MVVATAAVAAMVLSTKTLTVINLRCSTERKTKSAELFCF